MVVVEAAAAGHAERRRGRRGQRRHRADRGGRQRRRRAAAPTREALADAIVRVAEGGLAAARATAAWFAENAAHAVAGELAAGRARELRAERAGVALERQPRGPLPGELRARAQAARAQLRRKRRRRRAGARRAAAIAATSCGSNSSAASPATSGSEEAFEQATGTPRAIASSTGRPKPSYSDGNTKARGDRPQALELRLREPPREAHVARPRRRPRPLAQLALVPGRVAGQHEHRPALAADPRERVDQRGEVLVRALGRQAEQHAALAEVEAARAIALAGSGSARATAPSPSGTTSMRSASDAEQRDEVVARALRVDDHRDPSAAPRPGTSTAHALVARMPACASGKRA